ncbi:CLUMA_CG007140, isoform A [Clunio marinus]|uniref:CLUMA_CG007140, isoform A n=1 Tax=Clunio marinus TaxID=568069 RepID=A0A1J1I1H6_9DIPT|nr:CLUMA_CG007140, isoform A [Clunio marinus]
MLFFFYSLTTNIGIVQKYYYIFCIMNDLFIQVEDNLHQQQQQHQQNSFHPLFEYEIRKEDFEISLENEKLF